MRMTTTTLLLLTLCGTTWAQGAQGDGIWTRNAYFGELQTFDKCLGHQPGNGMYHNHIQPICLRSQLDDNLVVVKSGRTGTTYRETSAPWKHSPILGWAFDGYPIYGPYGYTDAMNSGSAVKRVKSGFRLRSIAQRTSLPDWALAQHPGVTQQLSSNQYGPDVSETFPLGRYVEDFEFAQAAGDLDQYNGRLAVTPEFPNGTYAYYVTISDDGSPAFPYLLSMQYFGAATGGNNVVVPANAESYYANGAYIQTIPSAPHFNSWLTKNSQQNAQVVSGFDPSAGPKDTWPSDVPPRAQISGGAATPAKADTQSINFTDTAVYVAANNLASYVMGPWFSADANGGVFQNFPAVQNNRGLIPRHPAVAATKTRTGLGPVGLLVNGVAVFNPGDGASYSNAARTDVGGGPVRLTAVTVSSASFESGPTALGALVTAFPLFGAKLATVTATAESPSWPTELGGATITIHDSAGTNHSATIAYASPTQVNYRVPEAVATGLASVTITAGGISIPSALNVVATYPNLFTFTSDGLAAAYLIRVRNGQQTLEPVYQVTSGTLVAAPIDLGPATDDVYLIVFGTGLGKPAPQVTISIGGVNVTPLYAGAQGTYTGLDQYNLLLSRSLVGKGKVDIVITANGRVANTVNITIK